MLVREPAKGPSRRSIIDSCYCNALFKRATVDQDFLDTLETHLKGTRRMALFRAWGVIDYARSLLRVAVLSFALAGFIGFIKFSATSGLRKRA